MTRRFRSRELCRPRNKIIFIVCLLACLLFDNLSLKLKYICSHELLRIFRSHCIRTDAIGDLSITKLVKKAWQKRKNTKQTPVSVLRGFFMLK